MGHTAASASPPGLSHSAMQLSSMSFSGRQLRPSLWQFRNRQPRAVPCQAAGTVRERVRHKSSGEMSLQQWDLERVRLERLAGSHTIVKFRRRQRLPGDPRVVVPKFSYLDARSFGLRYCPRDRAPFAACLSVAAYHLGGAWRTIQWASLTRGWGG